MAEFYQNNQILNVEGYEIYFTKFADSIFKDHFQDALKELTSVLESFKIPEYQIIKGGGGLSTITQSLGELLNAQNWTKHIIENELHLKRKSLGFKTSNKVIPSGTYEIEHYKTFRKGDIGVKIEWNNKDPFFDRDLETFRRLHQIGGISLGIMITRGASLQSESYNVFHRFLTSLYPFDIAKLQASGLSLSDNAKKTIYKYLNLPEFDSIKRITYELYSSKYGTSTTHMDKLLLRINRGVDNPCPLILIGIGKERLTSYETIQERQTLTETFLSLDFEDNELDQG